MPESEAWRGTPALQATYLMTCLAPNRRRKGIVGPATAGDGREKGARRMSRGQLHCNRRNGFVVRWWAAMM